MITPISSQKNKSVYIVYPYIPTFQQRDTKRSCTPNYDDQQSIAKVHRSIDRTLSKATMRGGDGIAAQHMLARSDAPVGVSYRLSEISLCVKSWGE